MSQVKIVFVWNPSFIDQIPEFFNQLWKNRRQKFHDRHIADKDAGFVGFWYAIESRLREKAIKNQVNTFKGNIHKPDLDKK